MPDSAGGPPSEPATRSAPVVHPAALPNTLAPAQLLVRPGSDGVSLSVDPKRASWRYLSFRTVALATGEVVAAGSPGHEAAVVIVGGGGVRIETAAHRAIVLPGRSRPFAALPWAAYLPPGIPGRIVGRPDSGRSDRVVVAIAESPSSGMAGVAGHPVAIGPDDVAIEVRGAGNATRQINRIIQPQFPADRLEIVEVLTPAGNWSSWPPHKHDVDDMPSEAVLEEIYYYQFPRSEGWGLQRLYRRDGSRNIVWSVGHGDVVLVTDGYHPFVAAHGYDAYYLNALAGDRRTMACSFDPNLDWTRGAWASLEPDARVPLVPPPGWPRAIDLPAA